MLVSRKRPAIPSSGLYDRSQSIKPLVDIADANNSIELAEGSRLTTILEEFQAKQMQVTGQVGEIAPTSNSLQNNPLPNTNPAQHANQQTPSTLPQNIQNQEAYQTSMYRAKMRWDDLWKKNETETLTLAE